MLLALALTAAAAQAVPAQSTPRLNPTPPLTAVRGPCVPDRLEHARNGGVLYRHGDRPAEHRELGELPDADMILAVYKRDERGCPIIDVVQPNVSTRPDAGSAPAGRASPPQRGRERQR